ncbi:MAG: peptidoglycan DD-metalloendopeptidase family protein [Hyphomicrobiales bacterium]|nr:peptidoglycan DD-metalloendopeptidase family protein [Hyphomicrobiales bacterium]
MATATVALLAGCADSARMADPFSNPFASAKPRVDRTATGSIKPLRTASLSHERIVGQPLSTPAKPSFSQAAAPVAPQPLQKTGSNFGHWTADGGTSLVAAQGESASMIAARYGVPTDALLHVNGLQSASQVQAGTRLIVPVYRANAAASSTVAPAVQPKAEKPQVASTKVHPLVKAEEQDAAEAARKQPERHAEAAPEARPVARPHEARPARTAALAPKEDDESEKPVAAPAPRKTEMKKAEAKKLEPKTAKAESHRKQEKLAAAPQQEEEETPAAAPAPKKPEMKKAEMKKAEPKIAKAEPQPAPVKTAKAEPKVDTTPTASLPKQEEKVSDSAASGAGDFRWPARGRVIQGFKTGGNDGINISVPEGTPVKAAENGTVIYSGSGLKGYGNLVLIRHPNGFVSAYGNNSALEVKNGDKVTRGQTIAKAGQTGNVSSPQVHFELRKGSTPVDPTGYLAGI